MTFSVPAANLSGGGRDDSPVIFLEFSIPVLLLLIDVGAGGRANGGGGSWLDDEEGAGRGDGVVPLLPSAAAAAPSCSLISHLRPPLKILLWTLPETVE